MAVDSTEVMKNASKSGIALQEIAIKYEGLTPGEFLKLKSYQVVTSKLSKGIVLAKFPETGGKPLFAAKATACLYLGA